MKLFKPTFTLLSIGMMISACSGGVEDPNDPNTPPTNRPPQIRDVQPTLGGGTYGGAINDVLTVFVLDKSGDPLPRADVIVEVSDSFKTVKTNAQGRVDFFGPAYAQVASVHALHEAHQFSSIYGANASVITLQLESLAIETNNIAATTVTGTVSGWEQLAQNTPNSARVAHVFAIGDDIADLEQAPRPGTVTPGNPEGTDSNLLVSGDDPFPRWNSYTLKADNRAKALAMLAGSFNLDTDPALEYTHLGFIRDIEMANADQLADQHIEITHPLNQKLDAIVGAAPELDNSGIYYGVRLPEQSGTIQLPLINSEAGESAVAPALIDGLSDASYHTVVRYWSNEEINGAPRMEVMAEQQSTLNTMTFDALLGPIVEPRNAGRNLAASASTGATMHVYTLTDLSGERTLWKAVLFGDEQSAISLPELPKGLAPRLAGTLLLTVTAVDLGNVDLNEASFAELDSQIRSMATSRAEAWF